MNRSNGRCFCSHYLRRLYNLILIGVFFFPCFPSITLISLGCLVPVRHYYVLCTIGWLKRQSHCKASWEKGFQGKFENRTGSFSFMQHIQLLSSVTLAESFTTFPTNGSIVESKQAQDLLSRCLFD